MEVVESFVEQVVTNSMEVVELSMEVVEAFGRSFSFQGFQQVEALIGTPTKASRMLCLLPLASINSYRLPVTTTVLTTFNNNFHVVHLLPMNPFFFPLASANVDAIVFSSK